MPGGRPEKPVRLRAAAELEALEAYDWYEARDPDVADRFDDQLRNVFSSISRRPHLCPRFPGQPLVQFAQLKGFPYLVIFRELEDAVEVIAVAHARRRPFYWGSRLDHDTQ